MHKPYFFFINRSGQHTTEYAILIGIVAVTIISLQYSAREAVGLTVGNAVDAFLGVPPPPPPSGATFDVLSQSTINEQGGQGFSRNTKTNSNLTVKGFDVREINVTHELPRGGEDPR